MAESLENTQGAAKARSTNRWRLLVSGAIGIVIIVALLLALDDPQQVIASVTHADPSLVLLALAFYAASYLARAVRFRLLIHSARPPVPDLLKVVSVHNLFNMLLPMRTGELSYVYLARSRYGISVGEGLATLLLARLYDALGIAVFFVAALLARAGAAGGNDTRNLMIGGSLLIALTLAILWGLLPAARLGQRLAAGFAKRRELDRRPAITRLLEKSSALVGHLEQIRERRTAPYVFLVTEVQWLMTFLTCYALLLSCPTIEQFPFGASVLGSTGLSIALILPINSFANVGTFEAGWVAGYLLAGLDRTSATLSAIAAHIWILLFAAALGGLGRLRLGRTPAPLANAE